MTRLFAYGKLCRAGWLLIVSSAVLAGCSSLDRGAFFNGREREFSFERSHPIKVGPEIQKLTIAVPPEQSALRRETKRNVAGFARAYLQNGHGSLTVSAPQGGGNGIAAISALAEINAVLHTAGLAPDGYEVRSYRAEPGDVSAPIILTYRLYTAEPAPCGTHRGYVRNYRNERSDNFGCSTRNNLAVMVADPHDLVAPRNMEPADVGRRMRVIELYRQGEPTGSERSDDETAAASEGGE